mgnify:CR=1 FL=1
MDLSKLTQQMLTVAPGTEAVLDEGARAGRAVGADDRVDLFLRMKLQSNASGDPLLHAMVSAPRDGGAPKLTKVTRGMRDRSFTRREQQYLDAMVAWAARRLPDAPRDDVAKRKPPAWRPPLEQVLRHVVGGGEACVRACLDGQEDLLQEADARARAQAHTRCCVSASSGRALDADADAAKATQADVEAQAGWLNPVAGPPGRSPLDH